MNSEEGGTRTEALDLAAFDLDLYDFGDAELDRHADADVALE
jgi:hypothetical protein